MSRSDASGDLGIEIVIEPDVVPRGTVDMRALPERGLAPGADAFVATGSIARADLEAEAARDFAEAQAALWASSSRQTGDETGDGTGDELVRTPGRAGRGGDGSSSQGKAVALAGLEEFERSASRGDPRPSPSGAHPASGRRASGRLGEREHERSDGLDDGSAPQPAQPAQPARPSTPAPRVAARPEPEKHDTPLALDSAAVDSPDLEALDEAAAAPMPPRPAAAQHAAPSVVPLRPRTGNAAAYQPTDLGEVSAFTTLAKLLAQLLLLLLGLVALFLFLQKLPPFDHPETALAVAPDTAPPTSATASVPVDVPAPQEPQPELAVATAPPAPETAPSPEAPTPEPTPTPAPEGTPQVAQAEPTLDQLRDAVAGAEAGAEVGAEHDPAGVPAQVEALRARAAKLLAEGKPAEAYQVLRELLALSPDDLAAPFYVGVVLERLGRPDDAERAYREAARRDPRDPRPLNNLGLLLLARGKRDEARTTFESALGVAPEEPDVLTNLAGILEAAAPAQAHPLYDKALDKVPTHGPARLGRARVREALGDRAAARRDLQVLVDQGSPLAPRATDALGTLARRDGRPAEAEALHRQALEKDPKLTEARVNLGIALLDQGKDADALRELEAATTAAPDRARAWQALGVVRSRLAGDRPEMLYQAKEAYERAIKLDPTDWNTHHDYALCAEQFGNFLFAMREYERAVSLEPRAWPALLNLSRLYQRGGEKQKALDMVDRALGIAPGEPDLHYQRAWLLAQEKRPIEARQSLQRFVETAPATDARLPAARKGLGQD